MVINIIKIMKINKNISIPRSSVTPSQIAPDTNALEIDNEMFFQALLPKLLRVLGSIPKEKALALAELLESPDSNSAILGKTLVKNYMSI